MNRILLLFVVLLSLASFCFADSSAIDQLAQASADGDAEKVAALLKAGADVNGVEQTDGTTPLIQAIQFGRIEIVKQLIQAGADINKPDESNGATPLMFAVRKGDRKRGKVKASIEEKYGIAELLIESGADMHRKNRWGGTALQWAADSKNLHMVRVLIKKGAKVNVVDETGLTPFMVAANYEGEEFLQIAKELIAAGAEINARDEIGMTALMKASMNHFGTDTIRFLIESGADVNAKTKDGLTALMLASKSARTEVVKFLIESGADIQARTAGGDSVLEIARQAGYEEVIAVLSKAGARE